MEATTIVRKSTQTAEIPASRLRKGNILVADGGEMDLITSVQGFGEGIPTGMVRILTQAGRDMLTEKSATYRVDNIAEVRGMFDQCSHTYHLDCEACGYLEECDDCERIQMGCKTHEAR